MAENVDYSENSKEYSYNKSTDENILNEVENEKFSNPYNYSRSDLYIWEDFVNNLKGKKIKIKRNLGWFYNSTKKEDINYTFDLYKKKFYGTDYDNNYTDKERDIDTFMRISKEFNGDEIISFEDFKNNRGRFPFMLEEITKDGYYPFLDTFSNLLLTGKIDVLKEPEKKGWLFKSRPSLKEDVKYTLDKYYSEFPKYFLKINSFDNDITFYQKKKILLKEDDKLINIYKNFMMENDEQLNNLIFNLLSEKKLSVDEARDVLIQQAKMKYNFEKEKYNETIKNYSTLSRGMKKEVENQGKMLDNFFRRLRLIIEKYDIIDLDIIEPKKSRLEILKLEEERQAKIKNDNRDLERKKYEEEIEDLEYKISDAQSKYSMNRAKLRKMDGKLKNLKVLEKRKTELQEKLRLKNLSIQERQNLLKEKTDLNEKFKNIEILQDQLADLKSKIPSSSVFEQEKILREREIIKLKNLNNASIREKNALLKSIELEKIKIEIRLREEQRYQQEQREKEELKQAKIVFLKEKKIAERKLDELKISRKLRNEQSAKMKEMEQDYLLQKKFLEEIKAMRESKLKEKKLEIEQKKLRTLEIEKQELEKKQDYAEQQKLFADSIQRDIDDLNDEKNILQNITLENEKILKNTRNEINKRQQEIEKTINLNIASMKQREADIFSEEAKIKLDVFYTLQDVKDQTAKKLDLEKKMQDLKDEIIRKQDVSDLLNETVEKISNTEISEAEEYNSFLESEIAFKKKLTKKNLNLTEYKETIAEEKEDLIYRLEHVKSQKLKKIYQLREKAIESQMKIILLEGGEDLKNNLFSLKYEIENLEKEKKISEQKEDLAKFQFDNFKRELNLRNQEIELLKNIRLKVLQKERLDARNQASQAIIDIVKKTEAQEKQDVREKLDEIIDDVETKEISRKSKAALFSMIDKIENQENKEAAKEKINFILGKIELHDNIEDARKKLDEFFKNKQIQKDVSEKLDEILDDIELDNDNYDYLDEEDDFNQFLSSVKKHISGEKRMEKFNKIDEILENTRKEDSKLKMDENIEMKDLKPMPDEIGEGSRETSFDEFSDYNFFINKIEDPVLKQKTITFLENIDGFEKEEEKIPKIKNAYKSAINSALWNDQLDLDYWDGNIILDEKAKFLYEQKVNNINTALGADYDIHIDPNDQRVREFLDIKLTETTSEKRGEINGYMYNGEKIISRNISRNFFFNYIKKPSACQRFIDELKGVINKTAKSQIASESYFEGKAVQDCALEYIGELREEQSYQIDSARNAKEMRDALREANDIDKEIKNIKKNLPFKMRLKIFRRTLSWRITKLLRLLWKHKGKTSVFIFTIFSAIIGVVLNQLGVVAVVHNLKKAARSVHQYANDVHEMGKRIIHNIQSIYRVPGKILGWTLIGLAFFLRVLYFFTRMSGIVGSSWIFGIFGSVLEISLYFSGNVENINEKAVEIIEETGNIIQNAGIRSQKYIAKNMPRWYYDKPVEDRTILQHIEAGAANVIFKVAKGTEYTGKKVQDAGEVMKNTLWYMQAFLIAAFSLLILIFIRNYVL